MKQAIIAGIIGLVVGAVGGYCACNITQKSKVEQAISDGVQKALDNIRGQQKQKVIENEERKSEMIKTTGRNINPVPHFSATSVVRDIMVENGYIHEPDTAPDDNLPFEIGKKDEKTLDLAEKHNIWDEEDPSKLESAEDYEARQEPDPGVNMEKLDPTLPPYEITADQYNHELEEEVSNGYWDKVTLIYFKDNVFAERNAIEDFQVLHMDEINAAIGKENVKTMVEEFTMQRMFVRNNKLHIDYEIIRSPRSYSSVLHEDEEE